MIYYEHEQHLPKDSGSVALFRHPTYAFVPSIIRRTPQARLPVRPLIPLRASLPGSPRRVLGELEAVGERFAFLHLAVLQDKGDGGSVG